MTGISTFISIARAPTIRMVILYLFDSCPQVIVRVNSRWHGGGLETGTACVADGRSGS